MDQNDFLAESGIVDNTTIDKDPGVIGGFINWIVGNVPVLGDVFEISGVILTMVMNFLGMVWDFIGEEKKAVDSWQKALDLDPNYGKAAEANYNLGIYYTNNFEIDRAIDFYSRAVKIDPNFYDAYWNRGLLYLKRKDFPKEIVEDTQEYMDEISEEKAWFDNTIEITEQKCFISVEHLWKLWGKATGNKHGIKHFKSKVCEYYGQDAIHKNTRKGRLVLY